MKLNKALQAAAFCGAVVASMTMAQPASAAVTFSGLSGALAAAATFDIVGGDLQVVLTNTSSSDVLVPTGVLTAVFFNVTGTPVLAPLSAISGGPTYLNGAQVNAAGTNVGGEWAFSGALSGAPSGANSGISSSGLNLFGQPNFNGPDLSPPDAVDGLQYGITSAGDIVTTGNTGVLGNEITKNSVTFLLDITDTFSLTQINGVSFQYGTALDEPNVPGGGGGGQTEIPEPASIALVGLGLLGASLARRRRQV